MDDTSKEPMYQKIVNEYKQRILQGELKKDTMLPTQIELARLYGTSEITSRRALTELVSEGLIYRIRGKGTFVRDFEDQPNTFKQVTYLKKICLINPSIPVRYFTHPFYSELIEGIWQTCEEQGVDFCISLLSGNYELPNDTDTGYITLSDEIPLDKLQQWRAEQRKIVTTQFYFPHLQIPYVIVDNLTGGYLATQHLVSLGHRRIGIILTGNSQVEMNQEFSLRLQGYKLALTQHNIPLDQALVTVHPDSSNLEQLGRDGFEHLFSLEKPPTAIFVTSDYKALGAMQKASEMGIGIPEDVSIIAYDNVQYGAYSQPKLTTVSQNTFKAGQRAANMLLFESHLFPKQLVKDEIIPEIIIRESCRKIGS